MKYDNKRSDRKHNQSTFAAPFYIKKSGKLWLVQFNGVTYSKHVTKAEAIAVCLDRNKYCDF